MKKLSENYYVDYFVLSVVLWITAVALVVCFIFKMMLGILFSAIAVAIFAFINYRWSKKSLFESPYKYEKALRDWKKRKNFAKRQGNPFYERRPERPKKVAYMLLPDCCATIIVSGAFFIIGELL